MKQKRKLTHREEAAMLFQLAGYLRGGLELGEAFDLLERELSKEFVGTTPHIGGKEEWEPFDKKVTRLFAGRELEAVRAILLLSKKTGGPILMRVEAAARLLQNKALLEEKIDTLTVQSRVSAWVVGLSPVGLFGTLFVLAPEFVAPLLRTQAGHAILSLTGVLVLTGLICVQKMARVKL